MSTKEDYVQYLKKLKKSKYTKGKIIFNGKKDVVYLYKSETIHHPPTWSLVMVTHWRRSLLIRYSKESSSLISNWPELQGLVVPLAIGTCCSDKKQRQKKVTFCYHRPLLICLFCCGPFPSSTFNLLYCVYIWEWQRNRFQYFFNQHQTFNIKRISSVAGGPCKQLNLIFYPACLLLKLLFLNSCITNDRQAKR